MPCLVFQVTVTLPSHFAGLWTATDDLPSLCRIYPQVPRQEAEDALLLWCHHSGGKYIGSCSQCRSVDWNKNIFYQYGHVIRWRSVFTFKVYGLAHTLHSLGDPDDTTCQVHQWCTEKTRRRGGRTFLVGCFLAWNVNITMEAHCCHHRKIKQSSVSHYNVTCQFIWN